MKCIVVKMSGEALENLVIEERPDPLPGRGEVAVAVSATALNRADLLQRRGLYPALDVVGASYWKSNLDVLRTGGRLILVGRLGGSEALTPLGLVMSKRLRITGTVMRSRTHTEKAAVTRAFEEKVVPLLERGEVRPVVDSVYPFARIREATAKMESNENTGKIVLAL